MSTVTKVMHTEQPKPIESMSVDALRLRGGIRFDYNRNYIGYGCGSYSCDAGPFRCDVSGGDTASGMTCCVCTTPCICCLGGIWGGLTCGNGC